MQPSSRLLPTVAVAAAAGAVRALQVNSALFLTTVDVPLPRLDILLTGLAVVSVTLAPLGAAVAGYFWGAGTDVRADWTTLLGAVGASVFAGFGVVYLSTLGPSLNSGGTVLVEAVPKLVRDVVLAVGLLNVPLSCLGGAAVAQFRTGNPATQIPRRRRPGRAP